METPTNSYTLVQFISLNKRQGTRQAVRWPIRNEPLRQPATVDTVARGMVDGRVISQSWGFGEGKDGGEMWKDDKVVNMPEMCLNKTTRAKPNISIGKEIDEKKEIVEGSKRGRNKGPLSAQ